MNPLDYGFCDRTVTIYRREQGETKRLVVENCCYSYQDVRKEEIPGMRTQRLFLLVMPGEIQRVFPGDLVYDGIGPQIQNIDWRKFLPALVPGLSEVAYAKAYYWDGKIAHVEAGRK